MWARHECTQSPVLPSAVRRELCRPDLLPGALLFLFGTAHIVLCHTIPYSPEPGRIQEARQPRRDQLAEQLRELLVPSDVRELSTDLNNHCGNWKE
jgi:hypothetical protein